MSRRRWDKVPAAQRENGRSETGFDVRPISGTLSVMSDDDWHDKPESFWRARLTSEQYLICREKGTEPPFSGEFVDHKAPGTYLCVCCQTPLFSSAAKFDSGSGWPSFSAPLDPHHIALKTDLSHLMVRTEALCTTCGAHLGHVFEDGPAPTGQRYCINSTALGFDDEDTP